MPKSEIFDKYAELAAKQGLIKTAEESKEVKKYKNETRPRAGSDDISTIEALYGVKHKDVEYEYNIIEQAHPNPVVVSPAHDKVNGLVENLNEQQSIIVDKIMNRPSYFGGHNKAKFAKQELVKQLIRIANDMDNRDKEELRVLADNCAEKISKTEIKKEAAIPLLAVGVGVAAVLGYAMFINKTRPSDQGIKNNCSKAIEEIKDLTEPSDWTAWFHQSVNESTKNDLVDLKSKLEALEMASIEYNNLDVDFALKKLSDIKKLSDPTIANGFKKSTEVVNNYLAAIKNAVPLMHKCIGSIKWAMSHGNQDSDSSWWATTKKLWNYVSSDDREDVIRYTETLLESCKTALQEALQIKNWSEKMAPQVEEKLAKSQEQKPVEMKSAPKMEAPKVETPKAEPAKPKAEVKKPDSTNVAKGPETKPTFNMG